MREIKKVFYFFWSLWLVTVMSLGLLAFSRPAEAHMLLKDAVTGTGAILHITPDDDPVCWREDFVFVRHPRRLTC